MADYYFKTLGDAWQSICDTFTSYGQMTYNPVDFNIAWVNAAGMTGGYFEVSGTTLIGPAFANGRYFAAEAQIGYKLPLGQVIREPGMQAIPEVTFVDDPAYTDALQMMVLLKGVRYAMGFDMFNGTPSGWTEYDTILDGFGAPTIYRAIQLWQNENDQAIEFVSILVVNNLPATSQLTRPMNPVYLANNQPVINNVIQAAPTLDVDATVNPGGGIYSITSRQLTTP